MRKNYRLGLALLASVASAMPAAAVVKVATFTGTLGMGTDIAGIFGAAGTSLAGASYVATAVFDTDRGELLQSEYSVTLSGSYNNSPIISTNISISGVTRSIVGSSYDGLVYAGSSNYSVRSYDTPNAQKNYFNFVARPGGGLAANIFEAGALDADFRISSQDGILLATGTQVYAPGTFDLRDFVAPAVNSVPEPASWAMFIAGFGLIGGMLRGRRPAVATG